MASLSKTTRTGLDVLITGTAQKLDVFDDALQQNLEVTPDAALAEITVTNPDGLNISLDISLTFHSTVAGAFSLLIYDDGVDTGISTTMTFGSGYNSFGKRLMLDLPDATKLQVYVVIPAPITADSTLITADSTELTVDEGATTTTLKIFGAQLIAQKNPLGVDAIITQVTQTL